MYILFKINPLTEHLVLKTYFCAKIEFINHFKYAVLIFSFNPLTINLLRLEI